MKPAQKKLPPPRILIYALYAAVIYCVIALSIWLVDDRFSYNRGSDSATYVLLAKSIAGGNGYSDINDPGLLPHTQYPPLFPLLLSPVVYLVGYNFMWMRVMVAVFAVLSLYLAKRMLEREGGQAISLSVTLLTATNLSFIFFTNEIAPETPYMFFSMASVMWAQRFAEGPELRARHVLPLFLVVAAYLAKLIGVAVYAAACVALLLNVIMERDRKDYMRKFLFFSVLAGMPLFLWFLRNALASGVPTEYGSIFLRADYYDEGAGQAGPSGVWERVRDNAFIYMDVLPGALLTYIDLRGFMPAMVYKALSLFILTAIVFGLVCGLVKRRRVMDLYAAACLLVFLVWPVYGSGDARRYAAVLVPFLYYYFFVGFNLMLSPARLFRGLDGFDVRGYALLLVVFFLSLNMMEKISVFNPGLLPKRVYAVKKLISENLSRRLDGVDRDALSLDAFARTSPCYRDYLVSALSLNDPAFAGAVVVTRKPEVVSLVSGRFAVRFPYTSDRGRMEDLIREKGATHVLLDACYPETKKYLVSFMGEDEGRFERRGGSLIYRIKSR